jgi:hypothetical protein
MGIIKTKKEKYFKERSTYYTHFFIYTGWLVLVCWTFNFFFGFTENEISKSFINQELIGSSSQRMSGAIQEILARKFGKKGILGLTFVGILIGIYAFYKDIFEFRRFLKKEKLFKQGLVDNMYDDYKPRSIFQLIKWVFSKKERNTRQKYKDINKLQKDLEKDGLYQKLYGKKDKK